MATPDISQIRRRSRNVRQRESVPELRGTTAAEQQVIHVFIRRAGGAPGRGAEVMPKAPLVRGDAPPQDKPVEDLTSLRRRIPPDDGDLRSPLGANLQQLKKIGIETSIRELSVSVAAEARVIPGAQMGDRGEGEDECVKFTGGRRGKPRLELRGKAMMKNRRDITIRASGVGKESGIGIS